jgi:hypothetical protein
MSANFTTNYGEDSKFLTLRSKWTQRVPIAFHLLQVYGNACRLQVRSQNGNCCRRASLAALRGLDGSTRQAVAFDLGECQSDGLKSDVQVEALVSDEELDLAGHADRHTVTGRVKVSDVEDAGGAIGTPYALQSPERR